MKLTKSKSSEWRTPKWLFDKMNARFQFKLDGYASKRNALCKAFISKKTGFQNVGTQDIVDTGSVWCNPPYDQETLERATTTLVDCMHNARARVVVFRGVLLCPAKTDQAWWHYACMSATEIIFIKGRLTFSNAKCTAQQSHAVFVFDSLYPRAQKISFVEKPCPVQ